MERSLAARCLALVVLLTTGATGCAGEQSRRSARMERGTVDAEEAPEPPASFAPAGDAGRPRLRHTVTLGQSHGGGPVREGVPAPGASAAPVIVVVQPAPAVWGWGAAGWVGAPGWGSEWQPHHPGWVHGGARVPAEPSRRPAPGGDRTPPPSYGPRFPFKTAPADPWR